MEKQVTQKTYYLFTLTMPLWLPFASIPLSQFESLHGWVILLFFSLIYGGVPYLALLVGVFAWARKRTGESLQRAAFILPLIFALLLPTCVLIFSFVFYREALTGASVLNGFMFLGAYALGFGYVYVSIALLSCGLLKHCGVIRDASGDQAPFISLNL